MACPGGKGGFLQSGGGQKTTKAVPDEGGHLLASERNKEEKNQERFFPTHARRAENLTFPQFFPHLALKIIHIHAHATEGEGALSPRVAGGTGEGKREGGARGGERKGERVSSSEPFPGATKVRPIASLWD